MAALVIVEELSLYRQIWKKHYQQNRVFSVEELKLGISKTALTNAEAVLLSTEDYKSCYEFIPAGVKVYLYLNMFSLRDLLKAVRTDPDYVFFKCHNSPELLFSCIEKFKKKPLGKMSQWTEKNWIEYKRILPKRKRKYFTRFKGVLLQSQFDALNLYLNTDLSQEEICKVTGYSMVTHSEKIIPKLFYFFGVDNLESLCMKTYTIGMDGVLTPGLAYAILQGR